MAKAKVLMPTEIESLKPSCLVVVDQDGVSRKFESERYNDLLWMYNNFTQERGRYKSVDLYYCTGEKLKPQLVVGVRLVGEACKENVHYLTPEARVLHDRQYMET